MKIQKLTNKDYWNNTYKSTIKATYLPSYNSIDQQNNHELIQILSKYFKGDSVLEIGAGDSDFLIYLTNEFDDISFSGMDYSALGCENLKRRANNLGLDIEVIKEDLFVKDSRYFNEFSMVYSIGVVEHFDDLGGVLKNIKRFCKSNGYHLAVIPNMAGIYGWITKLIDKEVYYIHNPHDLESFIKGHDNANMKVVFAKYVGFFNAGVLSSCAPFKGNSLIFKFIYKILRLITKTLSYVNKYLFKIPNSSYLSPYIVVVSKVE